jgi:2-keto-4-pentenoate hydratase/2-oxohepta-3-ene-1,7-dioic acid hydratase in catechol pathway
MKLVTFSCRGYVALGAFLTDCVVDLHRANPAISADLFQLLQGGQTAMAAARQALTLVEKRLALDQQTDCCHALADVELLAPIRRPGKVVCVGLNYRSHLAEISEPTPAYPILFHKTATALIGHQQAIVLPRVSRQVDYEGELAVIIGQRGKYIPEDDALSYVAGYTCANDVSAHDLEFRTSQWTSGKMLDTFCPLGPVLRTGDEVPDPGSLRLRTLLNGQTVQQASTSEMVFSVPFLVSYISSLATLEPGDVILTGTPAGIGCNRKPQVFLQPGDQVSVAIDGIGTLTNPVVAEEGAPR